MAALILSDAASTEAAESVLLMVSEVVTNAITAAGRCTFAGWFIVSEGAVRVEVSDTATDLPELRGEDPTRVGGHGLRIVDQLSKRWGVVQHEDTKTVWFEALAT